MSSCKLLLATAVLIALTYNSFTSAASVNLSPGSKCVYLKNVLFNEYLYSAAAQFKAEKNTNRVFTWRRIADGNPKQWGRTGSKENEHQGIWLLEKKASACSNCFTIKSGFVPTNPEPLFAVSEADKTFTDPQRRPVYTFGAKTSFPANMGEDIWEIETVPGFLDRIRIRSFTSRGIFEYLYAAVTDFAFDNDRRSIFTWSSTNDADVDTWKGAGDWIMTDATCPNFQI